MSIPPDRSLFLNEEAAPPKGIVPKEIYLVDNLQYSLEEILADDNGSYSNNGSPTNCFHYDGSVCTNAHLTNGNWFIKQRNDKKYKDTGAPETEAFNLHRIYRLHKTEENFVSTVCRIINVETNQLHRYCKGTYDWIAELKNTEEFGKNCHGNAKKNCSQIYSIHKDSKNNYAKNEK